MRQPDAQLQELIGTLHPEDTEGAWDYRQVVSVSGGKDSTAMYLLAMEQDIEFQCVFADVGNELPPTLDYVRELPARTGGPPIQWVQADFTDAFEPRKARIQVDWAKGRH